MGHSRFLAILLICAVLSLSLHQGHGRSVKALKHYGRWHSSQQLLHGKPVVEREMVEEMDYEDPGANTNPRSGMLLFPPPSPPPN